jgi:hypothetical protein
VASYVNKGPCSPVPFVISSRALQPLLSVNFPSAHGPPGCVCYWYMYSPILALMG